MREMIRLDRKRFLGILETMLETHGGKDKDMAREFERRLYSPLEYGVEYPVMLRVCGYCYSWKTSGEIETCAKSGRVKFKYHHWGSMTNDAYLTIVFAQQ